MATIEEVAETMVRRAQKQGYVVPSDIRGELRLAGLEEDRWKEVVAHFKDQLHYRQGRYNHVAAVSPRLHQEQEQQRAIAKAIRILLKEHKDAVKERERRGQTRVDFIQPVKVRTEDGKVFTLLSRDLSTTGIRLLGTKRLLGQKIQVELTARDASLLRIQVRVLWTCALGDDLFENGGNFLELV
jgi:hypothetical protein